MSRLSRPVERIIEKLTSSQILPVIVETSKNPREIFRQAVATIQDTLPRISIIRDFWFSSLSVVGELLIPIFANVIERFNMFSIPATRNLIEDLADSKEVVRIYRNRIMWPLQMPTVPPEGVYHFTRRGATEYYTTTYYTTQIIMGARKAAELGIDGSKYSRPLAVLDTTALPYHESVSRSAYQTTIPGVISDGNGHGVWVLAAAGGSEWVDHRLGIRTMGVAPRATLLSIKVLGFVVGLGSDSLVIEGLARAVSMNAKVINMSLGSEEATTSQDDDPQVRLINSLSRQGYIFTIAAGNSGPDSYTINSPGVAEGAITVGSYNPIIGSVSSFSSRGPTHDGRIKPDCVAPGENIFGPAIGILDYSLPPQRLLRGSILSGTSMSTPHVAGLVYLMAEHASIHGIDLTVDNVKDVLKIYGEFPEKSNIYGWGLLTWDKWIRYSSEVLGI